MASARRLPTSPIPWMVAINVMGVNLIAPVLPAYAAHYGVGFAIASSLLTAFALARMSVRLVAGRLSDRHGSRRICAGGGAIQASGAILAAFAPSIWVLLLARLVQGSGSAMFGTSINRYLLVVTDKGELGRAIAGFQSGILVGSMLGPLIGGVIADNFGIFAPFVVQAGLASILVIVSSRFVDDTVTLTNSESVVKSIRSLLRIEGFTLIMLLGFGLFFIRAGATNVLVPAFGDEVLAMSPTLIGLVISLGAVVSLGVMPLGGRLSDSVGRAPVALVGALGTSLAVATYGLTGTVGQVAFVSAITGIGASLAAVALPTMIGDLAPPGMEGLASGVYRIANDMGWVIGPVALGFLADGGRYPMAFVVAGVPLFLAGAVLWSRRLGMRVAG